MDSILLISVGALVLAVAGVLLTLVAAAEAGIIALSRGRSRAAQASGPAAILNGYLRRRHEVLRTLSVAGTCAAITATVTIAALLLRGRSASPVGLLAAGAIAALAITLLRQTARTLALLNPERTGLWLTRPIDVLQLLFAPLGWGVEAPVRALLRALGYRRSPSELDPVGELLAVLESTGEAALDGVLAEERRMMRGIMAMSEQTVRELMSPRMDLTAVSSEATLDDVMRLIIESGFTRIPLYEESIDRISGVIYAKDLLAYVQARPAPPELRAIARPAYFVPESKRANELLADMRRDQVQMAIAVDEYGGTAGVITIEDLLEEIVGQIDDEYDTSEIAVQSIDADHKIVDARLPLDDLNELFGISIESEDFDTVGGLILSLLGRLAQPGDEVEDREYGLRLRVLSVLGRRIKRVRLSRISPAPSEEHERTVTA
ncbi:MAG: HlyC/CorC family transporter [Dehalococcoidia bacterium]|nr:HlyC/CorC family transporter [Dehalococcoidia bacterium]